MKHHRLNFVSIDATLSVISSGSSEEVVEALLGASLESPDPTWVEAAALALTLASDQSIRRAGILAIGHLAIRFGALSSPEACQAAAARLALEPEIAGTVGDVMDDLRQVLDWRGDEA